MMRYILRFMLFDGPDRNRQTATQIHPDITLKDHPRFGYGEPISLGPDEEPMVLWNWYIVADIPYMEQIDDPEQPGWNALVFRIYLAKDSDWEQYEMPQHIRDIIDRQGREPEDRLSP